MTGNGLEPIGDGWRDGPDAPGDRRCPVCASQVLSARARFCSGACRMRAHRRRHAQPPALRPAPLPPRWPKVYECPECEQRYLDQRRCPECNLFCRLLGPGGSCPHCEEPIVVAELFAGVVS